MSGLRSCRGDDGASAVEYGLIVFAVAAVIVAVVVALGGVTLELFQSSCTEIDAKVMSSETC